MYKRTILVSMCIMFLIFSACAKNSDYARSPESVAPASDASYNNTSGQGKAEMDEQTNQDTPLNKKIIQNFQVSIKSDDVKITVKEIENKTKELGGYTEMEELMEYGSSASIRIPSQKVDLFIEYLEKNFDVTNKNKSIEDVTDVYVDNDARIKNLKAEESQVLEVLKKAATVDEILKVQSELYRIREEIEILESRKKNWDRQVEYSTVRLSISKTEIVPDKKIKILSTNEFFGSAWKGFKNTFMYFVLSVQTLLIFLFSNLIPFAILGGLGYGIYWIIKKQKK